MRDFKGMKRQRGRNRNGGGAGGGGGKPQHNANRAFDSNGPEGVKVRGAAQHVYEKYQQLARDAHTSGDRVLAENHLQHAEHYFRMMRAMQPQRPLSDIIGRDQFVSGYDIDFEDESGGEAGEAEAEASEGGEGSDYRASDYRNRDDRPREERFSTDRPQNERGQNERQQGDRQARAFRDDRPREDRPRYNRDDRPRYERQDRFENQPQPDRPVSAAAEPQPVAEPIPDAPVASVLRADDGEVNHAPAFLQVRPAEPRDEGDGEARRPRRRRAPRSFDAAEAAPANADEG
jgi:hypothetical protein